MSLRPYTGEYMVSPVPLHLDMDACSHGCWWCFSCLNKPDRRADYASLKMPVLNYLSKNPPGKNLAKMLLQTGYPILVSNTSDPFAASVWPRFSSVFDLLMDAGIPITIQTRGGKTAAKVISSMRPTMIYISITSDRNDVLRRNEPGAPRFEERMELIKIAREAGHFVVVGLNPFYLPWWDNPSAIITRLVDMGIGHVWWGGLHLNRFQVQQLTEKQKKKHASTIDYALKRVKSDEGETGSILHELDQAGINVFSHSESTRGNFWEPYFELGYPFFPTMDGFISDLQEVGQGEKVAFGFECFDRWANIAADFRASECKDYCTSFGRSIRNKGKRLRAHSLREVHEFFWRILEFPTPLNNKKFHLATEGDKIVADMEGRDILIYAPDGDRDQLTMPLSEAKIHLEW